MTLISTFALLLALDGGLPPQSPAPKGAGLQIIVVQGEDAINVIQQKTAVAPIVEVRDRNGLPVSGAVVTFAIEGGKIAAFPGATSTMTVATNAAGRAAAAAISPLGAGSVQIQVQAVFQGQTVAATIAQSNVLTAAEAVGTTASAAGSSAAGGAGSAAGGGGISGTALGVIGAAVAGGALAATQLGESDAPPSSITRTVTSLISGTIVHMISFPSSPSCTIDHALNGTLTMELIVVGDVATGTLRYSGTDAQVAATCFVTRFVSGGWAGNGPVSGTRASLSSRIANSFTSTNDIPVGATNLVQTLAVFEGAFDGTMVNGTFTYQWMSDITGTSTQRTIGRVTIPVTLR